MIQTPQRSSRSPKDSYTLSERRQSAAIENVCEYEAPVLALFFIESARFRYNNAMATIRRVPSVEHNFQLVITRVYEEGDQELLEDEDESTCVISTSTFYLLG
jgi:hypothetical protein